MGDQNVDSVFQAVAMGSLGFGALATLEPGTLRRSYGDATSTGAALDYFGRTWGTRTAVLGALMMTTSSEAERTRFATYAGVMNAADSLAAFTARGLPRRTRVMAGLTSAGFAVASFYVAGNG